MTQDHKASRATNLLITDGPGSVLRELSSHIYYTYTPFGYDAPRANGRPLLGFNSQLLDLSCTYLLGNGYRAYNPTAMRFNSPDSLSPFSGGGINAYIYCSNDPINNIDPSGHIQRPLLQINATYKAHNGVLYKTMPIGGEQQMVLAPPGSMKTIAEGIAQSQTILETLNKYANTLKAKIQPELKTILKSQQTIDKNSNTLAQLPIPKRGARDRDSIQKIHLRLNVESQLEQGRINIARNSKASTFAELEETNRDIKTIISDIFTAQATMNASRSRE